MFINRRGANPSENIGYKMISKPVVSGGCNVIHFDNLKFRHWAVTSMDPMWTVTGDVILSSPMVVAMGSLRSRTNTFLYGGEGILMNSVWGQIYTCIRKTDFWEILTSRTNTRLYGEWKLFWFLFLKLWTS